MRRPWSGKNPASGTFEGDEFAPSASSMRSELRYINQFVMEKQEGRCRVGVDVDGTMFLGDLSCPYDSLLRGEGAAVTIFRPRGLRPTVTGYDRLPAKDGTTASLRLTQD